MCRDSTSQLFFLLHQSNLPDGLRKLLASQAEKSKRSLNSEIVWRLGQTLGPEGAWFIEQYETTEEQLRRKLDELVKGLIEERRK